MFLPHLAAVSYNAVHNGLDDDDLVDSMISSEIKLYDLVASHNIHVLLEYPFKE